jgi:hypothetical protein
MYVGTGSTRGWKGWLKSGRHRHSLGQKDWQERQASSGWATGVNVGLDPLGEGPSSGGSQSSYVLGSLSPSPTQSPETSDG